ncbi:MAG TPA: phosphatase PAP2 family protein [Tepidisphaeraceae bacterium]
MKGRINQLISYFGGPSPLVLVVVLIATAGVWLFVKLADEVREGDTQHLDERVLRALRKPDDPGVLRGPHWVFETTRDITSLGSVTVLVLTTAGVLGYLLITKKYHAMWLVLAATVGGLAVGSLMKFAFARARPTVVPHLQDVGTASFPSGHSMYSAIVYLTLASLLSRIVPERAAKVYFIIIALVLIVLIGVSRVCLGVHYPTDVMGGWCAGMVWALVCWLTARYLQRRGAVEKDSQVTTSTNR